MYDIITIGGATQDIMFVTEDGEFLDNSKDLRRQKLLAFEYGAKIYIKDAFFSWGGGGLNTAVSLARLGLKTATVLSLGQDDSGRNILAYLKKEGIQTRLVKTQKKSLTSFSFIVTAGKVKEHVIFSYRGANEKLGLKFFDLKSNWFYLSSLSGPDWPRNIDILMKALIKNTKLAWNPGQKQLVSGYKFLKKYLEKTEVIILNKDEAIELVLSSRAKKESQNKKLNEIPYLLEIVSNFGPKIVVITDAERGAYVWREKQQYYTPALSKKRVDTTGVGDAFSSSLVAGLILFKDDLEKALKLAAVNSASVVSRVGAHNGLLKFREAKRHISKSTRTKE